MSDDRGARDGGADNVNRRSFEVTPGKYLLIEVPDWSDGLSSEAMSSYLRLGAVKDVNIAGSPTAPRSSGEDLAGLVKEFIDDTRVRDGCPEFIPVAERLAETAKLHIKGGWRDHSDGNRITTTRGDKVEVIKGNYRMLVLGRQDHDAGWDVSGGHVGQTGITFQGSSTIQWVQTYDGTWKVVEETIKGDVLTTYHGDVVDVYYGNIRQSTTGSESPLPLKENPKIIDRTWAVLMESYTGSAALPVPMMKDETWADVITSMTTADTITSETTAKTITDTTTADAMSSTTTVSGAIEDSTTAGSMSSMTRADSVESTTIGNVVDTTIGTSTSIMVGAETEIIVGNEAEVTVGTVESITIGGTVDVQIAATLSVQIGGGIEVDLAPTKQLGRQDDDIKQIKNEIHQMKNVVSQIYTTIAQVVTVRAAQILLG